MAYRGGGRGRGRGRGGRGFPMMRDEDGTALVPKSRDGPPPLFPSLENIPGEPVISSKDEQLVSRRRHLESAWNVSPYYIEKAKPKSVGIAAEIERYSDRYKLKVQTKRPPLSSVLKHTSAYFPAELIGQGNRGRSAQSSGAQWTLQATGKNELQRLDQLANLEQKRSKDGDDKDEADKDPKKKKEGEEGDGDDEDEVLEDEDEDIGDDDYAQNFGFDDDEDYLDMDDGGGDDEGATYM